MAGLPSSSPDHVTVVKPNDETLSIGSPNAEVPTTSGNDVRIVKTSEYKAAAHALAEAFADDDVARYFIDTPDTAHWSKKKKWDLHVNILEYITYAHILNGLVTTAGPDYGCVALWMPPGKNMDDLLTILRSGLWRLHWQLSAEGRHRFFKEFFPLLHETKHAVLGPRDASAYYLVYVGTRPSARGKGLARKCIEFVTRRADAEGATCYLESSNDVNPIIYGKLGFELVRKIKLGRAEREVLLDIMVREPVGLVAAEVVGRQPGERQEGQKNVKVQVTAGIARNGSAKPGTGAVIKASAVVNAEQMVDKLSL